jgi:hypothetical protein
VVRCAKKRKSRGALKAEKAKDQNRAATNRSSRKIFLLQQLKQKQIQKQQGLRGSAPKPRAHFLKTKVKTLPEMRQSKSKAKRKAGVK